MEPGDEERRPPQGAVTSSNTHTDAGSTKSDDGEAQRTAQHRQHQPDDLDENNRPGQQMALPGMETSVDEEFELHWGADAMAGLDHLSRGGGVFSADHLRELVGLPTDRNRVGRVFSSAAKAGLIEEVAAVRSSSPSRRSGLVRVWRGKGAA